MIKFNALEKLVVRLNSLFSFKNNKKIINRNSPNYGSQTIADAIINKTELPQKTIADIRKLVISKVGDREFKVVAVYSDGETDGNFQGHWYGWQHGGNGLVWTPLTKSNSVNLGQSRFTELSVWVREQNDDKNVDLNVHSSIAIGDQSWR